MSFDTGRFDLTGFDVTGGMYRRVVAKGTETVSAIVGSALIYHLLAIGNERVATSARGIQAFAASGSGEETISEGVTEGLLYINPKPIFTEIVSDEVELGAEIGIPVNFTETVNKNIILGADIAILAELEEAVNPSIILGADITIPVEGFELISADATSEAIETKVCVLNITLKPGDRLIIDANNYNVLLNGNNAIWVQSGDWIDELIRNTTEIKIDAAAGAGNINASILYTERYL